MFFIGIFAGFFMTYNISMTKLHNECVRGDQASCIVEKRENIFKK